MNKHNLKKSVLFLSLSLTGLLANALTINSGNNSISCKSGQHELTIECENGLPPVSLDFAEAQQVFHNNTCLATFESSGSADVATFNPDNPTETTTHNHSGVVAQGELSISITPLERCTVSKETGNNFGCVEIPGFQASFSSQEIKFASVSILSDLTTETQKPGIVLINGMNFNVVDGSASINNNVINVKGSRLGHTGVRSLDSVHKLLDRVASNNNCE